MQHAERRCNTILLSVAIPIFNEQRIIRELYSRLVNTLNKLSAQYEILFVNDGSTDSSLEILKEINAHDKRVRILSLSRNFGHQAALTVGLDHARGDAVILMDGDLQDPPEVIEDFFNKWKDGWNVVYGVKKKRKEGPVKKLAFWAFYRILRSVANITLPLDAGIFSLLDRTVVDKLRHMPEINRYLSGLRYWVGFQQVGIEYERGSRYDTAPRQTSLRLLKLALDALFSFSHLPLRLASCAGFVLAALTVPVTAYVLYSRLFTEKAIPGWASILVSVMLIGSVQLIGLGIIGEYIGRIYDETKRRPIYILAEKIGFETETGR